MFRSWTRAAALVAALLVTGLTAPSAVGDPAYPTPDPDPFYAAPGELASLHPGDVVRTRQIDTTIFGGSTGWQVAFRSTNSVGKPIMATTTVMLPPGVSKPPLVSYQALINALGTQCSPSHSLFSGELQDGPGAVLPIMRGWAVSLPDYWGPQVAYAAGRLGGMVVLDSIRAVQKVPELGLAESPVGIAGYSGGALATSWAGALQPTYAPELKLAGVVAGGIPADLEQMARGLGFANHPGFGLAFAAAMGLEREYPDRLPISSQLNDEGLWFREFTKDACRRFLLFHGVLRNAEQLAARKDLMDSPEAFAVLRENSIRYSDLNPTAPHYYWQGIEDFLTPYDSVAETVGRYCRNNVPITFVPYNISEHMTAAVMGLPAAWEYMEARFRNEPVTSTC
ncbi:lipase family protein [Nocardia thailandica]